MFKFDFAASRSHATLIMYYILRLAYDFKINKSRLESRVAGDLLLLRKYLSIDISKRVILAPELDHFKSTCQRHNNLWLKMIFKALFPPTGIKYWNRVKRQ